MFNSDIQSGSLVLYKIRPAIVTNVADKIEILLEGGKSKRVRDKDVVLLHPGPATGFDALRVPPPNPEETWELLAGEKTDLPELAELLYDKFTPGTAWGTWKLVADGLFFEGNPDAITGKLPDQVSKERNKRESKAIAKREWDTFIKRIQTKKLIESDGKRLAEVERVALGHSEHSRILTACQVQENSEHAHRFLIRCGYWPEQINPWPQRLGVNLNPINFQIPVIAQDKRTDLTQLEAYAIDDVGNQDPDDAISIEGDRLWVHVADVAALVSPDSEMNRAACERGSNLYLPEGVITMLPEEVTHQLGLGLSEESPALSFGFRFVDREITDIEIIPSRVRVIRTSYEEVEQQLEDSHFSQIREITTAFHATRLAQDAAEIRLPEVIIKLEGSKVVIRPIVSLHSREMVTNAMLMAGVAAARYAQAHDIAIPYAIQPSPKEIRQPKKLSEMYAYRRLFKPSSAVLQPDRHFGLGLDAYTRATSPLRRYLDLLTHQQLRAAALGSTLLSQEQVSEYIWTCETAIRAVRRAERLSNLHWKLVYLKQNPKWQGDAVIVSVEDHKAVAIIPELALETKIRRSDNMQLDTRLQLTVRDVNLFDQTAYFRVLS